jgi:hypothetical protein
MPDPRLELTAQELTYAATGVRSLARQAERDAVDPKFESCKRLFEDSAEAYRVLARKLERIAEGVSKASGRNADIPAPIRPASLDGPHENHLRDAALQNRRGGS